jgi:hypothetical protein
MAGEKVPVRAPACIAPRPAIRQIGAFSFSKSPKRPQVRVMRMAKAFAKRRATFFSYPIFAIFLVTFVQNVRGIVDYSKNDMSGYILCGRFVRIGSYLPDLKVIRARIDITRRLDEWAAERYRKKGGMIDLLTPTKRSNIRSFTVLTVIWAFCC